MCTGETRIRRLPFRTFSRRLVGANDMIQAVIFDMDGVLVDSEPFWQEAEMNVFATVGLHLTRAQCIETTGLPIADVVAIRFRQHPWNGKAQEVVSGEITGEVIRIVLERAVPLDGVPEVLEFFRNRRLPLALASSSSPELIAAVLGKLSLTDTFQVVHSAEQEQYGKPHPAVFLSTAGQLHTDPARCLVFEDSFNGLIAAKAARMKTVALPMRTQRSEPRFDIADVKLNSLEEFSERHWEYLNSLS